MTGGCAAARAACALVIASIVVANAAAPVPPGGALREIPFAKIKYKVAPMLVVFYDTDRADPRKISRALQVAMAASRRVGGVEFFKCDTAAATNAALAEESKLRGDVHIFSRTVDGGIDEFRLPVEVHHLVRYLHLRGVVGDPEDVVLFSTAGDLAALAHPLGPRPRAVLARFFEPWCAYCFRMREAWEAAATFFRGRAHFVDVDCGASAEAGRFCDAQNVTSYPVLRLFSVVRDEDVGEEALGGRALPEGGRFAAEPLAPLPDGYREYRADWTGSRSLAGLEWALHTHRAFLPRAAEGVAPSFDVTGEDAAGVPSIFGIDGRDATVRLADYASLPPGPDDKDEEALAARLGLAGADATGAEGRTDFVEEDEEDEEEAWAALEDGGDPVML